MKQMSTLALGVAAGLGTAVVAYPTFIRPWQHRWGASDEEVSRAMPGDDLVANPLEVTTRAVTVNATPREIWPWLVQMGYQRGGLYSYDWIDRLIGALDRPSADRVIPELQNLRVGDILPYARGADMNVRGLDPYRMLLLELQLDDVRVTQAWGLYPIDSTQTRLVLRVRAAIPLTPLMVPTIMLLDPAEWFMVCRQLQGIKRRAETLASRQRAPDESKRGLASRVAVRFKGTTVRLSGNLDRWAEKDVLVALLRHAPGVQRIEDGTVVRSP